jgi:predicted transcriptional regulator
MKEILTIRIKPVEEGLKDFQQAFQAVRHGRKVVPKHGTYFTSIEAARNFLTPERLALLRAIRGSRPGSISELARVVKRDLKTVQTDLKILEKHGLVRFREARQASRRTAKAPVAPYREIALKIAI